MPFIVTWLLLPTLFLWEISHHSYYCLFFGCFLRFPLYLWFWQFDQDVSECGFLCTYATSSLLSFWTYGLMFFTKCGKFSVPPSTSLSLLTSDTYVRTSWYHFTGYWELSSLIFNPFSLCASIRIISIELSPNLQITFVSVLKMLLISNEIFILFF